MESTLGLIIIEEDQILIEEQILIHAELHAVAVHALALLWSLRTVLLTVFIAVLLMYFGGDIFQDNLNDSGNNNDNNNGQKNPANKKPTWGERVLRFLYNVYRFFVEFMYIFFIIMGKLIVKIIMTVCDWAESAWKYINDLFKRK